jgi:hypothetical protein
LEEADGKKSGAKPPSRWMYILDEGKDSPDLGDEGATNARVQILLDALKEFFEMILPRHSYADPCFMLSYWNAQIQQAHTDVLGILRARHKGGAIPSISLTYSVIIAFDDETYLYVYDRESAAPRKVHIPKYSMCIFAADVIHSGMDLPNSVSNFRFHAIIKSKEYTRGGDAQGWLKWNAEVLQWQYEKLCDKIVFKA